MDAKFKEVCCNIRACLNSSKRQSSLAELSRDYKSVLGESIPYQSLRYPSLEALIRDVPQLKISRVGNEIFIDVKPDEKTIHISKLVRDQKTAKKKPKKKPNFGRVYQGAPPPRRSYNDPPRNSYRPPPPPRSNDYYPTRNRDPPPRQPIVISSEEEDTHEKIISRYRSSQPSQYDFSDPNESIDEGSDFEDANEINDKMEALNVTLKYENRQVKVNKNSNHKVRGYHSTTSNDDDIGYGSMNEISTGTANGSLNAGDAVSQETGDKVTKRMPRSPATLVGIGKAMLTPNDTGANEPAYKPRLRSVIMRPSRPSNPAPQVPFAMSNRAAGNPFIRAVSKPMISPPQLMSLSSFDNLTVSPSNEPHHSLSSSFPTPPANLSPLSPPISATSTRSRTSPSNPPNIHGASGSKMSDPNMFKPGPNVQPNLSDGTYCGKLHEFTVRHSLQTPVFKTFTKFCPKTHKTTYMCKVKIGSSIGITSCPYESPSIGEVQEYTAQLAYEELQRRYESLDTEKLPVTEDENEIIKRVADIVTPHSTGLKCEMIEDKYKILYQELLPLKWLDIITNRSLLSVEKLLNGIAVYPVESINVQSDVSKLPPLILPEIDVWSIFVTCCTSTACVYFRIVHDDYNGLYEAMDEKMLELYNMKKNELQHVDMVKEGSYYAAYLDKSWFRVKALSTIVDDCVRVSLIDHGDIDEVRKEHLFPLDERFTNVPAQKVSCSLTGLEEFSKEPYITKMVYDLTCGKTFVAKVDSRNPHLELTLLDTSTDADINVNELILERIDKELSPPVIPPQNNVTDAYIVSVKEDGLAFVQIISESFKLLKSYLAEASQELAQEHGKFCVKSTQELVGNKIFLAKYAADGQWYRVLINRVISEEEIEVIFVDYGNLDLVQLTDIADIKHFTDALGIMPHQAVQVRLVKPNDELFTENVLQFLMDLSLPRGNGEVNRYLMKTITEGVIPDVQMFLRLPDTNELVNLNDIIASYFPEYRSPNFVSVKLSTETMERVYPIPNYEVPIGEQFYVFVTMVSSPFNFIVQPYNSKDDLTNLMSAMSEFYEKEQPLVDISNVQEDQSYAVKTDSGKWYRGIVVKVLNGLDCISMKLIDYGDIVSIKFSNLAQLLPCFRNLPKQAIKAELAGVVPLHLDWTVEDSLRFKNLVSHKALISVVVDVHKDGKISIILYDTSTKEEIDVGAVLVEEGRAKDITK